MDYHCYYLCVVSILVFWWNIIMTVRLFNNKHRLPYWHMLTIIYNIINSYIVFGFNFLYVSIINYFYLKLYLLDKRSSTYNIVIYRLSHQSFINLFNHIRSLTVHVYPDIIRLTSKHCTSNLFIKKVRIILRVELPKLLLIGSEKKILVQI